MQGAVKDRLEDSEAVAIITTPELFKRIPVKELPALKHVVLVGQTDTLEEGQYSYFDEMSKTSEEFDIQWVDREDGLILHYTSGSTGKPKGCYMFHIMP